MLNLNTTANGLGAAPVQGMADPAMATGKSESSPAATSDTPPVQTSSQPTRPQLDRALEALQHKADSVNASLQFRIDEGSGKTVVTVINAEDGSVIRQIPSEEALALSQAIAEQQGLLINTRA